jgi:hypothetical protein
MSKTMSHLIQYRHCPRRDSNRRASEDKLEPWWFYQPSTYDFVTPNNNTLQSLTNLFRVAQILLMSVGWSGQL